MSYLVNKLNHNLNLKAGYLTIKQGFSTAVRLTEEELKDASIADAISRGWAELSDAIVTPVATVVEAVLEAKDPFKGLSEAQMKEELANKEKVPVATGTQLGQDGLKMPPATSEAIGVPEATVATPEVIAEVVAETAESVASEGVESVTPATKVKSKARA